MSLAVKTARANAVGDPGFFGAIGGALKGAVGGLLTGGPLGVIGGAISGGIQGARGGAGGGGGLRPALQVALNKHNAGQRIAPQNRAALMKMGLISGADVQARPVLRTPGIAGALQRIVPGGATGFQVAPGGNGAGGGVSGFHLNKSDYFLRSGEFVPAGTRWVRNRRRNPGNARANSRAIARIKSAKRMAKSLSHVTVREKKCR